MNAQRGRVVCVDDDHATRQSLHWLLWEDFDVLTAPGGEQALEIVRRHDVDVVLSDQYMPGMTGVELLDEIRTLSPRSMRILLGGNTDLQAVMRAINESEVFRIVAKPWNSRELPHLISRAVAIARLTPAGSGAQDVADTVAGAQRRDAILVIDDDPVVVRAIAKIVGEAGRVYCASNLADAVGILSKKPVSVIVSETRVGSVDATRLLRLLKGRHPQLVIVMLTAAGDAAAITTLVNECQIYRFVAKPVRAGQLCGVIESAVRKARNLAAVPAAAQRHVVDAPPEDTLDSLRADVALAATEAAAWRQASAARAARPAGIAATLHSLARRLLPR